MWVASLRKSVRRKLSHAEITYIHTYIQHTHTHTHTEGRFLSLQTQCMQNSTYLGEVCVTCCLQEVRLCKVWAVSYSLKPNIKDTVSRLFTYFIKALNNLYLFLSSPVGTFGSFIQLFGKSAITPVHLFLQVRELGRIEALLLCTIAPHRGARLNYIFLWTERTVAIQPLRRYAGLDSSKPFCEWHRLLHRGFVYHINPE